MTTAGPAKNPCGSCPYRKDVPSGVWVAEEYDKLPAYDADTADQPMSVFLCHQQDGRVCAGWVGCHDMDQNLALRMAAVTGAMSGEDLAACYDYAAPVPLWESGQAAADHGKARVDDPDEQARRVIDRVEAKRRRGSSGRQ